MGRLPGETGRETDRPLASTRSSSHLSPVLISDIPGPLDIVWKRTKKTNQQLGSRPQHMSRIGSSQSLLALCATLSEPQTVSRDDLSLLRTALLDPQNCDYGKMVVVLNH